MSKRQNKVHPEPIQEAIEDDERPKNQDGDEEVEHETRVGKRLNESTQRRVIIMVLSMLFSVPILSISTYY
jgi:hypothetical protein